MKPRTMPGFLFISLYFGGEPGLWYNKCKLAYQMVKPKLKLLFQSVLLGIAILGLLPTFAMAFSSTTVDVCFNSTTGKLLASDSQGCHTTGYSKVTIQNAQSKQACLGRRGTTYSLYSTIQGPEDPPIYSCFEGDSKVSIDNLDSQSAPPAPVPPVSDPPTPHPTPAQTPPIKNPPAGTPTGGAGTTTTSNGFVPCGNTADTPCNVTHLFRAFIVIIDYLISMAGFLAVLAIVFAGFQMVYSQSESGRKEAKGRLTGAIIGVAIVAVAYILINAIFVGSLSVGVRCGGLILSDPKAYINSTGGCQ